jgi:hypothetical protein
MHLRVIALIFIVEIAIACWNRSMFEAQIAFSGYVLLCSLRRVEQCLADDIAARS